MSWPSRANCTREPTHRPTDGAGNSGDIALIPSTHGAPGPPGTCALKPAALTPM